MAGNARNSAKDRDDELKAAIRNEGLPVERFKKESRENHLSDGPVNISHDTLMGKMPKADKILKKGDFCKLTSSYEWKPVNAALTEVGLFLSRPDEDVLRDLIPLYEVVEVRKRSDIPGESSNKSMLEASNSNENTNARSMKLSSLMIDVATPMHIVQIRTVENGYNSGRTYYFKVESEEECNEWITRMRTESDRAVILKQAGPSLFRRLRYRLRRFYHGVVVQSLVAVLIFFSFVVNIVQTELLGPQGGDTSSTFSALEYFFVAAFAAELAINFLAHFFYPFFKVPPATPSAACIPCRIFPPSFQLDGVMLSSCPRVFR